MIGRRLKPSSERTCCTGMVGVSTKCKSLELRAIEQFIREVLVETIANFNTCVLLLQRASSLIFIPQSLGLENKMYNLSGFVQTLT